MTDIYKNEISKRFYKPSDYYQSKREDLIKMLPANVREILDVGCGDGNFTASLAERSYEMYGVDLSEG